MNYVDFAIAVSLFLFFFIAIIVTSTNYFSSLSDLTQISEFRTLAEVFFKLLFESHGMPEDWQQNPDVSPVELGLMDYVYRIPVLVVEDSNNSRTDDLVDVNITFDDDCENKTWNDTIRVFDDNLDEVACKTYKEVYCTGQFLKGVRIFWKVNISENQRKLFYIYYSSDESISTPNYTYLTYSTSNWVPNDGDSWTENNAVQWSCTRMTCSDESTDYKVGYYSIEAVCNDSTQWYTAEYDPSGILNLTDYKKLQFWLKSNTTNDVTLQLFTGASDKYVRNITPSTSWTLYEYDVGPDSTGWTASGSPSWSSIDWFNFYYDSGSSNSLWIDGFHFKRGLLEVNTFPEERFDALSSSKINALENMSYEQVLRTLGDYKFRIEVTES